MPKWVGNLKLLAEGFLTGHHPLVYNQANKTFIAL